MVSKATKQAAKAAPKAVKKQPKALPKKPDAPENELELVGMQKMPKSKLSGFITAMKYKATVSGPQSTLAQKLIEAGVAKVHECKSAMCMLRTCCACGLVRLITISQQKASTPWFRSTLPMVPRI